MASSAQVVGREQEIARIVDALRSGVSTVIVGPAGVGKSAVARELATRRRAVGEPTVVLAGGSPTGLPLPPLRAHRDAMPTVVIIDDVHLLDPAGVGQLTRRMTDGRALVVATARSDGTPLRSIGWLWSAGACERLPLGPLAAEPARVVIEQQLGGEVDDTVIRAVRDRSRGNPLLLGHLLRAGVRSGALVLDDGRWRLVRDLPLTTAVADAIRGDLAGVDDRQLQVLQTISLTGPLRLDVARRIAGALELEALEGRRLITVDVSSAGSSVSCAHPLYAELLRSEIGVLRSQRLRRRVLREMDARSDGERLLLASWRLELGEAVDATELLACARIATPDTPILAETLLRPLLNPGCPEPDAADAAALLAHLLLLQGRVAEAHQLLNEAEQRLAGATGDWPDRRAALAAVRVSVRTRLGEIASALELFGAPNGPAAADRVTVDLHTQALHAQLMMLDGRLDEALRIAHPLLPDTPGPPTTTDDAAGRATAAYTVVAALSFCGRLDDTDAALERAVPVLTAARHHLPFGLAVAQVSTAIGHVFAGRLASATRLAHRMREIADQEDDPWQRPRSATVLGLIALHRGDAAIAVEHVRAAITALVPLDAMFIRYNLAFLARAAALAGQLAEARQALQAPTDAPDFPLYQADWQIAEAAVLAASSRPDPAATQAMTAARTAARHGQWGVAAIAAHDAARYTGGEDAARFLCTAADLIDGPLPPVMRDHAVALSRDDVDLLQQVSLDFERLGYTLFAAEAAYAATRRLSVAGQHHAADRQASRAAALHGQCAQAYLPWALGSSALDLTARERHVALLAAGGHTDRQIADQLQISIRTVQAHLTHVYGKLRISRRSDLPAALATDRR